MNKLAVALLGTVVFTSTFANVDKGLAYKSSGLSADDVAAQNYFVNHFFAFDNYGIGKSGNDVTAMILRPKDSNPLTLTLERYLNNKPTDEGVNAQDLAIFRSGKLKGTGMLITDFVEEGKSQTYEIYIPSIRKVRRFAEPARDDSWGGSDFTFGDVTLRKIDHETHALEGTSKMSGCLRMMKDVQRNKYTQNAKLDADCSVDGKEVYKLKSTAKDNNWWYDYRISYIDTKTFADYRTEYFKDGKQIKFIDRSWVDAGLEDPRSMYWGYWYGSTIDTGHETLAFIPRNVSVVNKSFKRKNLWSTQTLKRMPRKID